ncbi:hypothetical protein ES703_66073 [subsurface metagenome]
MVGTVVYLHRGYERLLHVEPNDVVLDVGAGGPSVPILPLGCFTVSAAKKVGQGGLVISVEPCPKNAADLGEKVARAGSNNVIIIQKAAWNRKTSLPFHISPSSSSHTLIIGKPTVETVTVEADTLDNIVSDLGIGRVDFIKMDIEGAEVEALMGAEQIIGMARKVVVAAYHTNRQDISPTHPWVSEFLQARGFQTHTTYPGLVHAWATPVKNLGNIGKNIGDTFIRR